MPQGTTLTVNDRAPTPVPHDFEPWDMDKGIATFKEVGSVRIGQNTLSIRWRENNEGRRYVRMTLTAPILVTETVNGVNVPTVPRTALIDCTFRFDNTSTEQERKNMVGMFHNMLSSSQTMIDKVLVGQEGIY